MYHVAVDDYVLDVLLPDLAGHDKSPAAFLVYIIIWTHLFRSGRRTVGLSLQALASQTGLSKSAVQSAVRRLQRRSLVRMTKRSPTAVPEYELIRHWLKRRASAISSARAASVPRPSAARR
jgi:DNA-binding IclR family transcriptional regulator